MRTTSLLTPPPPSQLPILQHLPVKGFIRRPQSPSSHDAALVYELQRRPEGRAPPANQRTDSDAGSLLLRKASHNFSVHFQSSVFGTPGLQ